MSRGRRRKNRNNRKGFVGVHPDPHWVKKARQNADRNFTKGAKRTRLERLLGAMGFQTPISPEERMAIAEREAIGIGASRRK